MNREDYKYIALMPVCLVALGCISIFYAFLWLFKPVVSMEQFRKYRRNVDGTINWEFVIATSLGTAIKVMLWYMLPVIAAFWFFYTTGRLV